MSLIIFDFLDYAVQNIGKHRIGGRGDTFDLNSYLFQYTVFNMGGICPGVFTINF